jgi:hypothetical protein
MAGGFAPATERGGAPMSGMALPGNRKAIILAIFVGGSPSFSFLLFRN